MIVLVRALQAAVHTRMISIDEAREEVTAHAVMDTVTEAPQDVVAIMRMIEDMDDHRPEVEDLLWMTIHPPVVVVLKTRIVETIRTAAILSTLTPMDMVVGLPETSLPQEITHHAVITHQEMQDMKEVATGNRSLHISYNLIYL